MSQDPRWHRLSPVSGIIFLANTGKALVQAAPGFLAAAVVLRSGGQWTDYGLPLAIVLAIVFGVILPAMNWYFYRYKITGEQILIRSGVISRKRLSVDFDRIQGVKLSQNPVFRLFRVFNLSLDTAGSAKDEVALPGVRREIVDLIRSNVDQSAKLTDDLSLTPAQHAEILKLGAVDIVKIGITSNALIFIAAIAAPLFSLPDGMVLKFFRRLFEAPIETVFAWILSQPTWLTIALLIVLVLAVFGLIVGLSVLGSVIRYHGFELRKQADRLVSTAGMLTRHEQSIPVQKVQLLGIDQNLRQRLFGCFTVSLRQASSHEASSKKNFRIPYALGKSVEEIANIARPGFAISLDIPTPVLSPIDRRYILRTLRNVWLPPIAVVTTGLIAKLGVLGISGLITLIPAYLVMQQVYRRWGYAFTNGHGFVRSGFLSKSYSLFELRRTQRITVTQTPFQRRKGLANLTIYLASNRVSIPYIPESTARLLQDEILYQVETDVLPWI